jgi:Rrf2 family protein
MRSSSKGLYAPEAMTNCKQGKIHEIAEAERIREKFLELTLLDLKNARLVESVRGARGGYRLRRPPNKILPGETIGSIDGPVAPLGGSRNVAPARKAYKPHSALCQMLLDVRNAAAGILDHTSLCPICAPGVPRTKSEQARTLLHRSG